MRHAKLVHKMNVFTYILPPPPPPPRSILNNLKQRHSTHEKMCNIWTQRLQGHNERYYCCKIVCFAHHLKVLS